MPPCLRDRRDEQVPPSFTHISELADFRVKTVEEVVKTGDMVTAMCVGVDDKGRVKMSRKAAMKLADKKAAEGSTDTAEE